MYIAAGLEEQPRQPVTISLRRTSTAENLSLRDKAATAATIFLMNMSAHTGDLLRDSHMAKWALIAATDLGYQRSSNCICLKVTVPKMETKWSWLGVRGKRGGVFWMSIRGSSTCMPRCYWGGRLSLSSSLQCPCICVFGAGITKPECISTICFLLECFIKFLKNDWSGRMNGSLHFSTLFKSSLVKIFFLQNKTRVMIKC